MFWVFGHKACGISAPQPGIEPSLTALEGCLNHWPLRKSLPCRVLEELEEHQYNGSYFLENLLRGLRWLIVYSRKDKNIAFYRICPLLLSSKQRGGDRGARCINATDSTHLCSLMSESTCVFGGKSNNAGAKGIILNDYHSMLKKDKINMNIG